MIIGTLFFITRLSGDNTGLYLLVGVVVLGWVVVNTARYMRSPQHQQNKPSMANILEQQWTTWYGAVRWLGIVLLSLGLAALLMAWSGNPISWGTLLSELLGFLAIYPIMFAILKLVRRKNTHQDSEADGK